MAVEDVPQDKIINQRKSYFQVLYYIPLRDLYRWDDRYDYMLAVGYIPVEGQTIPPTLPPGPGSPFSAAETQYLDANYASDAEVQQAVSDAGSALGIAQAAKTAADEAQSAAGQASSDAANAGAAADRAREQAGNAASLAGNASQSAADASAAAKRAADSVAAARESSASILTKFDQFGNRYEVLRVKMGGQPFSNVFKKQFAGDYEKQGTSGTGFIPPLTSPMDVFTANGYDVVANAGGWRTSGNVGEIVGCQIMDGVIYHDFDSPSDPVLKGQQGLWSMGFRADGFAKMYSVQNGDTAASMLADGVIDSFSFGPHLVVSGVQQDLESNPALGSFNTEVSARQILGQSINGDIILITVYGKSGVYGIKGNQCSQLAASEGCHNAIMLDGGGSAQTVVSGDWAHPSSDALLTRPVAGFLSLRTRMANQHDTGWIPLTLNANWTQASDASAVSPRTPSIRRRGSKVSVRGRVIPPNGTWVAGSWANPANVPPDMVPATDSVAATTTALATSGGNPVATTVSILGGDNKIQIKCAIDAGRIDLGLPPYDILP